MRVVAVAIAAAVAVAVAAVTVVANVAVTAVVAAAAVAVSVAVAVAAWATAGCVRYVAALRLRVDDGRLAYGEGLKLSRWRHSVLLVSRVPLTILI